MNAKPLPLISCTALLLSWIALLPAWGQQPVLSQPHALTSPSDILPKPAAVTPTEGIFALTSGATIVCRTAVPDVESLAVYLAERLRPATGFGLRIATASDSGTPGDISLALAEHDSALGKEGYELRVTAARVQLGARTPARPSSPRTEPPP